VSAVASLTIVMPVHNEAGTVERAIARVLDTSFPVEWFELIVVDDGSTDGTRELLSADSWPAQVRLVRHERNRGKGAAIRSGLAAARGSHTAVLDADLEYDPADTARLIEQIAAGEAEVVYGTRGFESHSAFSFWYVIGNKGVTFAANLLYNSWISDIMTCHKVLPTSLFDSLSLRSDGFEIEAEITAKLLRRGVTIYEIPVTYRARSRAEGKQLTARDGLRVIGALLRCRVG
jgi:glycosyltransferase involved in cell wall biosynthesis